MPSMAKEKKGRPSNYDDPDESGRTGKTVNLRIDPVLAEAIPLYQKFLEQKFGFKVSKTSIFERALREIFKKDGFQTDPAESTT